MECQELCPGATHRLEQMRGAEILNPLPMQASVSPVAEDRHLPGAWWFSVILIAVYVGTFQLWYYLPRPLILASGGFVVATMGILLVSAARQNYFGNRWDAFWHMTVLLDLAIEAIVIKEHDGRGFYLCALAFAVVIGGYHVRALRNGVLLMATQIGPQV